MASHPALDAARAADRQLDLMLDAVAAGLVHLGRPNRQALDLAASFFARWQPADLHLIYHDDPWGWAGLIHFREAGDDAGYQRWLADARLPEPPHMEVLRLRVMNPVTAE